MGNYAIYKTDIGYIRIGYIGDNIIYIRKISDTINNFGKKNDLTNKAHIVSIGLIQLGIELFLYNNRAVIRFRESLVTTYCGGLLYFLKIKQRVATQFILIKILKRFTKIV